MGTHTVLTPIKTSKCGFVVCMSQITASKCKKLNLLCAWKKHSSFVGFIFKPEILNSALARAHLAFKRSEWKTFQRHHLWICYFQKRSFKLRFVHFWLTRLPSTKTSNLKHTKMNVEFQKMVHQMHYCVLFGVLRLVDSLKCFITFETAIYELPDVVLFPEMYIWFGKNPSIHNIVIL